MSGLARFLVRQYPYLTWEQIARRVAAIREGEEA